MTSSAGPARPLAEPPTFFLHVMKTGGTTLLRHIQQNFELDEIYPHPDLDIHDGGTTAVNFLHFTLRYLCRLPPERRELIKVYVGHFPFVALELLGGPFRTMTLLRDPVARTISQLRQFQRPAPWAGAAAHGSAAEVRPLEEVYEDPLVFAPLVHNHQTKLFSMGVDDEPTGYMQAVDIDASRLATALDNLATIDAVGVTERYDEFLGRVEAAWGWRLPRERRANVTPLDEGPRVSDALRRRIAEDNAIDVELYARVREGLARASAGR